MLQLLQDGGPLRSVDVSEELGGEELAAADVRRGQGLVALDRREGLEYK